MNGHNPEPAATRICLVVPCYNEAERLAPEQFLSALRNELRLNLLFVDDGSTDRTGRVLADLCATTPERIRCLRRSVNGGKAEAVREGVLAALSGGYGLIGYWDADLATPLAELKEVASYFESPRINAVLCSRVNLLGRNVRRRLWRHYFGRFSATLISFALRMGVYDTQCGAKLFRANDGLRAVFDRPFTTTWVFDAEILARFQVLTGGGERDMGIIEHPVREWRDVPGSKVRFGNVLRTTVDLCRIRRYVQRNRRGL